MIAFSKEDTAKMTGPTAIVQAGDRHVFRIPPVPGSPSVAIEWEDEAGHRLVIHATPEELRLDVAGTELRLPFVATAPSGRCALLEVEWLALSAKILLDGQLLACCPHAFTGRTVRVTMPAAVIPTWAALPARGLTPPHDGAMDHVDPTVGLKGWALNREEIGRPLRIDVVCQGRLLAHAHTLLARPDLDAALGTVTRCGFAIGWHRFNAEAVLDLASSIPEALVELRIAQTGGALRVVTDPLTVVDLAARLDDAAGAARDALVESYATLAGSGLLDIAWYQAKTGCAGDPLLHYLTEGEAAGHPPNFYFDPGLAARAFQLEQTSGALAAYARSPRLVPRPSLHFNQRWYSLVYPAAEGLAPVADHLLHLRRRAPNPFFDPAAYRANGPDEANALDPYRHYLDTPQAASLRASSNFDAATYLTIAHDEAAPRQPFLHFLSHLDPPGTGGTSWLAPPSPQAGMPDAEEDGISVVVPNRNYARYLYQRMESIFRQHWPVLEVIVIDDASEDGSINVVHSVARHFRRDVDLVLQARSGGNVFRQWLRAAQRARGRYLWIAEADDSSDPRFLGTQMEGLLKDDGALFAFCDSRALDADGRVLRDDHQSYYATMGPSPLAEDRVFEAGDFLREVLTPRNLLLNASAVIWRRAALLAAFRQLGDSAFDLSCAGDWRIYLEACRQSGRMHYRALPLNDHRKHPASVSQSLDRARHLAEIQTVHTAILQQTGAREEVVISMQRHIKDLKRAWGIGSL